MIAQKEGKMEGARMLFEEIQTRDDISFNAMITGYDQNERSVKLYAEILLYFSQKSITEVASVETTARLKKQIVDVHKKLLSTEVCCSRSQSSDVVVQAQIKFFNNRTRPFRFCFVECLWCWRSIGIE